MSINLTANRLGIACPNGKKAAREGRLDLDLSKAYGCLPPHFFFSAPPHVFFSAPPHLP
jgi:hypothetical protein